MIGPTPRTAACRGRPTSSLLPGGQLLTQVDNGQIFWNPGHFSQLTAVSSLLWPLPYPCTLTSGSTTPGESTEVPGQAGTRTLLL